MGTCGESMSETDVIEKTKWSLSAAVSSAVGLVDDRINPIVVKELRQAVQSRFVTVVIILFLAVELVAIGLFLLASEDIGSDFEAGRNVFGVLQGILLAVCLLFVPLYTGIRLAAERSETNVDLLFITTIRPSSIIWGKFLAGMVVTVLIYSACAPFMVLTYLLRGIDLPTIALILGLNLLVIMAATQLGLLAASISVSLVLKIIVAIILFIAIVAGYGVTMSGSTSLLYFGIGGTMSTWDFWGPVLSAVAMALVFVGLLFFFCVALISPTSSNRALPLRIYLTTAWLVTGGIFWAVTEGMGNPFYLLAWAGCSALVFTMMLFIVVCERDGWGPRMQRNIPRRRWLRPLAFLFYSGSAGGLLWCVTLIAASLAVFYYYGRQHGLPHIQEAAEIFLAMALYGLCYALTATLLVRYLLPLKTTATFAIALFLMTVGCVLPPLVMFFWDPAAWDLGSKLWMLANPIGVTAQHDDAAFRERCLWLTGIWAATVMALLVPWFIKQVRAFRPVTGSTSAAHA
jgi:ABC-type transport system involved in multi-copper enzyme maturation permease subunit